jgi:uncharacterized membrane protein
MFMHISPILALHIFAGMVALLSGTAAVIFRKGGPRHAISGKIFVVAMLTMAAAALYLAVRRNQPGNILGSILTLYLISTAWLTARRREPKISIFDWLAMLIPIALGVGIWLGGIHLVRYGSPQGPLPVIMSFFMGTVMFLAAGGDLRMILRGGITGVPRITRHLWRMCLGFFIATGSFFTGQGSKMFPGVLHDSAWLFIPAFAPLALLVFWVFRVRFAKTYHQMFVPRTGSAIS